MKLIEDAMKQVAKVKIKVDLAGSGLFIDGEPETWPEGDEPLYVNPGVHDIEVRHENEEAWKSTVVLVNKWDAIEKDAYTMDDYTRHVRQELNFMDYVPLLFISAKTGQRVDQVLPMALRVQEERLARITTAMLNRVLRNAQDAHPAPSHAGRQLKIYYGSQVRVDPPTFVLHVNDPKLFHFSYSRYLENQFRETYGFIGTPIKIIAHGHKDE